MKRGIFRNGWSSASLYPVLSTHFGILLLMFCMAVALCSCRSAKHSIKHQLTDVTGQLSIVGQKVDSLTINLTLQLEKQWEQETDTHEVQTVVRYSEPDSIGSQFITEEIRTERTTKNHLRDTTKMEAGIDLSRVTEKNDSIGNHWEKHTEKEEEKEKKPVLSSIDQWISCAIMLGIVISCLLVLWERRKK